MTNTENKTLHPFNNTILQKISYIFMLLIIVAGLYRTYDYNRKKPWEFRTTGFYLDTYVEIIAVIPAGINEVSARETTEKAMSVFAEIDKKYNFLQSESFLYGINNETSVRINDPELENVLNFAMSKAEETQGTFDPTLGALKLIYPIGKSNPVPPTKEQIEKALGNSGYERVRFNDKTLEKPKELLIDLGGVVKGYAVEKAAKKMAQAGLENFIVNAGGNVRTYGRNIHGELWKVGVENPRKQGGIVTILSLDNQAVATSGDYQRYFYHNGVRYHHIFDSKTGKPALKAISATVIAPDAMTADVYSTAVFVMGREKGLKFLEDNKLEGIIFDEKGYGVTQGLKNSINVKY
jgi:FAD:protein FMN transferase